MFTSPFPCGSESHDFLADRGRREPAVESFLLRPGIDVLLQVGHGKTQDRKSLSERSQEVFEVEFDPIQSGLL